MADSLPAGHPHSMSERVVSLPLVLLCILGANTAQAQDSALEPREYAQPSEEPLPAPPCDPSIRNSDSVPFLCPANQTDDRPTTGKKTRKRLFPLGGQAAINRGYRIPEPWGLGLLIVKNTNNFDSRDLAVAVAKGNVPPEDATLLPLPAVTTNRLEGDNTLYGFKADLWLFPGVNLFASLGKVKGTNLIDVNIDLDAIIPRPFCRPARPCGSVHLPIETRVDNVTFTVGTVLIYGNEHWFALGSIAKTVSISSQDRSDVRSTNLGIRAGPRFRLGEDTYLAPYFGANYFDLDTTVKGVVTSGPVFDDGDTISMRYRVEMSASHPWAALAGLNLELNRHLSLQAELQASQDSTRVLTSASIRF
ncbi:autotransporter outer membrane beta-barrel domain-containing protein [Novosphingobium album (ex Hu et al. 2023)]|uniref:Autotransporter outer membrane beta-barrel domain-containing protein n=1 Tax=Novosphingobium album (ex Hu et al. 2023) TaxID=2930093 RepID=A0ABT0B011_9SPHN|nr:autotransporter outer membrane beta-barrel domain-containing protein [Novosphingobium album (ex Hu et al. 2023)]MCJ2178384.1 autotransporter outer membrane beta-barrel domain-containing protein [Novosphingobium album (ex Hu et al. 2023)]